MQLGEQNSRAMSVGQVDLFGLSAAENSVLAEWPEAQRLAGERETLGLFLSGHPITPYEPDLKFLVSARLADVGGPKPAAAADGARAWTAGKATTVAGLVLEIRRRPESGHFDPGRPQRPPRGQPVRRSLPAASRHHRQGRDI